MPDKPTHKCGVTAAFGLQNASVHCYKMLRALQHRGPEGAGIAVMQPDHTINVVRNLGSVEEALKPHIAEMHGTIACGHNRYATAGEKESEANLQPFVKETKHGWVAVGHNGNIPSADIIRTTLVLDGDSFASSSDTEVFLALIARSSAQTLEEAILDALGKIDGAFCFVIMSKDTVWAVSDPRALHPLVLGQIDGAYVVASETCAFDGIGAEFVRDIRPGELLTITEDGLRSTQFAEPDKKHCFFEWTYFARPDSNLQGKNVAAFREKCGEILARQAPPPEGAVVIAVPQSSLDFTFGFVNQSHARIRHGLLRLLNTRSFLEGNPKKRAEAVRRKLAPIRALVQGQVIVVIDDSLVRNTTATAIISMLRDAGASEVHMRIACPPIMHPCMLGIDMSTYAELAAANNTIEEIRRSIGADSLAYLSLAGLNRALQNTNDTFCQGCLTGIYPKRAITIPLEARTSVPA